MMSRLTTLCNMFACVAVLSMVMFAQTGANAATNCVTSNYTNENWLSPDAKKQLGLVPVNGVPSTIANKPKGGTSGNCDFHIFSWQWFLYLMNPTVQVTKDNTLKAGSTETRNFQDRTLYPVVDLDTCKSITASKKKGKALHKFVPHVLKVSNMDLPDETGQAGSGDALYDKNKNIVFYTRSFTKNECGIYQNGNFPDAGNVNNNFPTGLDQVLELKSSWRILTASDDASKYFTVNGDIEGIGQKLLGLVGFHVVVNTKFHPEFIWATFEHRHNTPDCTVVLSSDTKQFSRPQPKNGWSFANQSCNACVAKNYTNGTNLKTTCATQCKFNTGGAKPVLDSQGNAVITGNTSNICIDKYYGGGTTQNLENIQYLNTLLVGPTGILTSLPASDSMAVFKNYFLAGAEWSDVSKPNFKTTPFSNTRTGSVSLANSTLESFTQADGGAFFVTGCFSCHGGAKIGNTADASHLLTAKPGAAPGKIDRCNVKAGPIFSQAEAQTTCPKVCKNGMGWNGHWSTIVKGSMSVCGCNACPTQ